MTTVQQLIFSVTVEVGDLDFPTSYLGEMIQVRGMKVSYTSQEDGELRVTSVEGRGVAYKAGGFEIGRAKRNVYGFWSSVPRAVKDQVHRAVLDAVAEVKAA